MDCGALRDDPWERIKAFVPGGTKGKHGQRTHNLSAVSANGTELRL